MAKRKLTKRRIATFPKQQNNYVPSDKELESALQKSAWGKDSLSQLMQSAYKNTKISYLKAKPYVELFGSIADAFIKGHEQIDCSDYEELMLCSFFNRSFSNFVATARLMFGCQVTDSFSTLRSCLENSLYAYHLKTNPSLQAIYQNRDDNEQARKEMRRKFQIHSLFENLGNTNSVLSKEAKTLYNMCIDYGAHPNVRGAIPNIKETSSKMSMVVLNADEPFVKGCMCVSIKIGKCALSIFNLVYSEEFKEINMSMRIDNINKHFKPISSTTAQMLRSLRK